MDSEIESEKPIVAFHDHNIRRVLHNDEWWFVILDVIVALTDSTNPSLYLKAMRRRDPEFNKGWVQIVSPLTVETPGGKQKLNCANTEGIFRLIQSIPSPKAEPFKRWLAKVGYDRVKEIENPELASQRAREIYKAKGYSDAWIEKRMRGIQVREELTSEWKNRNVGDTPQYAILTAEICKTTFGMTPSEYKKLKELKRENLRDHMTDLELIFTMLREASTTEIARTKNAQGFKENHTAARLGGAVSGNARKELESKTNNKVITKKNSLENLKKKIEQTNTE
jgi:DNA-damage-inducible protein D